MRPIEDYLRLEPLRDVIELPLDQVFDVNGWDIAKALRLLLKGNAVLLEWMQSPLLYRGEAAFRAAALDLARKVARPAPIALHYLSLGVNSARTHLGADDGAPVKLKKLFYALRPALALEWMAGHPEAAFPPMHFPTLLAQAPPPEAARTAILDLLARKAVTRELGEGVPPPAVTAFIRAAYERAAARWGGAKEPASEDQVAAADDLFRSIVTNMGAAR